MDGVADVAGVYDDAAGLGVVDAPGRRWVAGFGFDLTGVDYMGIYQVLVSVCDRRQQRNSHWDPLL